MAFMLPVPYLIKKNNTMLVLMTVTLCQRVVEAFDAAIPRNCRQSTTSLWPHPVALDNSTAVGALRTNCSITFASRVK